jgi:hypothetical protein
MRQNGNNIVQNTVVKFVDYYEILCYYLKVKMGFYALGAIAV